MEKKEIQLAKLFHDTYERLAPEFGYTTREDTKEFEEDSPNGKLMIAVCKEVMLKELDRVREEGIKSGVENVWGMINSILDTLDVNKNEEEISILVGILKILDTEITKLSKLTTK